MRHLFQNTRYKDQNLVNSLDFGMMLQHPGASFSDISASALVPCLSPPGSLTLDDFTNFTPLVKEELRYAIQTKRLSNGMSALTSDRCQNTDRPTELPVMKREVRMTHVRCKHALFCVLFGYIEQLVAYYRKAMLT